MDSRDVAITALTGPPFVSLILNWGLFGALSIQVYLYCQVFPNDPLRLRLLVCAIFILETVQTVLLTNAIWRWLVSGFGKVQALDLVGVDLWISVCVVGGIVAFLVQCFYAYRIKKFSQNSYISFVIVAMSVCSLVGALGSGADIAQSRSFTKLFERKSLTYILIGFWSGSGSACDVVIAISMCYYLRKGVQGIHFASTKRLISRLARLTLETGTLTASVSVVSLLLFYIRGSQLDYEVPISATAKLYSTTLLAVLNSRMNLSVAPDNIVSWACEDQAVMATKRSARIEDQIELGTTYDSNRSTRTNTSRILFSKTRDTLSSQVESGTGGQSIV